MVNKVCFVLSALAFLLALATVNLFGATELQEIAAGGALLAIGLAV